MSGGPGRRLWERVRAALLRVGRFQSALLLSLIYLVLWLPVGLLTRLLADWLRRRPPEGSAWQPRDPRLNGRKHAREPF